MKRHRDAIAISDGACNPVAIVNAMAAAIAEMRANGITSTDAILDDAALKLMTYQLAFLQGIQLEDGGLYVWVKWLKICEAIES